MNNYTITEIGNRKLQLNYDKCKRLHFGKNITECTDAFLDEWTLAEDESGNFVDKFLGKKIIQKTSSYEYLGDIISDDYSNTANIKKRTDKCQRVITDILLILKNLKLGQFYFQIAITMRNALFLSVLTHNSEVWHNLNKKRHETTQFY